MQTIGRTRSATLIAAALLFLTAQGGGASSDPHDVAGLAMALAKAGDRVAAIFSRAQSLICTETVSIRPLDRGMSSQGFGRKVESELRLWWESTADGTPATAAQTQRQVLKVNNRTPNGNDPNNCTVPEQNETETPPLAMLLPEQRREYEFKPAGAARVDGRTAMMIDFRQVKPVSIAVEAVEGNDDCISYEIDGGFRGRIWLDRETHDVLRLDQRLAGLIDVRLPKSILRRRPSATSSWVLERWDTSIRFASVAFQDPEESLVLPRSSVTMQVARGSGTPRMRTEIQYANYKRFLTSGRVIGPDADRDPDRH